MLLVLVVCSKLIENSLCDFYRDVEEKLILLLWLNHLSTVAEVYDKVFPEEDSLFFFFFFL